MEYTLQGIKTFRGTDGQGLNATLYRDGIKVAFVIDAGCGGDVDWQWFDRQAPRETVHSVNSQGTPFTIQCTPEEAKLYEFLRGKTWKFDKSFGLGERDIQISPSYFIAELANDTINENRFKRLCKSKTVFRLKTDEKDCWRTLNAPFDKRVKDLIVRKFGDQIESIMNETLGQVAI